ncbi:hypothetical protein RG836_18820 [Pseudomonas sp. SZMC_28357]|uniref:hypothetical protein n=1 Tax=Pseudomonas sp. SZMC_28357 TaxID=3074380 RepID=UPI0028724A52|nr:hypothetical protein [Pseudomonas sp. SZMC_28357]MDR9753505.1 hypothetical protein [Pseudomonas sp. SZMC_28357]
MTRLIPHHELAIGSDQIIDPDQAVYDLRQAFNYPYDLQGFDDFLNAFGINHSNYMRAANQQKLIDAVSRGDWVMVRPKAVKDSGGASWNSFNPKPEPAPAQHLVEEHAFTVPKPVESGFHIVQQAMSLDALERALYEKSLSDALRKEFRSLNRHLGERVKPGQMVIFSDSRHYLCRREEAQMMAAAQKVDEALRDLTEEEAAFLVENHELIEPFLEISAGSLGVASFMVGQHLESLKNGLKSLEALHQEQFRKYGHLHSQEFLAQRKPLMAKLDASLGPFIRKGTGLADHPKLKRALGLSTRRTLHHWSKAGAPTQLPGYATNIAGVARAAKFMQTGGYIGIGLATGASGMRISEVCRSGTEAECQKVKFIEGAKLAGNVGGSAIAGVSAAPITMEYCANLALKRRPIGGVLCVLVLSGAAASLGGNVGSKTAELTTEIIYETVVHD